MTFSKVLLLKWQTIFENVKKLPHALATDFNCGFFDAFYSNNLTKISNHIYLPTVKEFPCIKTYCYFSKRKPKSTYKRNNVANNVWICISFTREIFCTQDNLSPTFFLICIHVSKRTEVFSFTKKLLTYFKKTYLKWKTLHLGWMTDLYCKWFGHSYKSAHSSPKEAYKGAGTSDIFLRAMKMLYQVEWILPNDMYVNRFNVTILKSYNLNYDFKANIWKHFLYKMCLNVSQLEFKQYIYTAGITES